MNCLKFSSLRPSPTVPVEGIRWAFPCFPVLGEAWWSISGRAPQARQICDTVATPLEPSSNRCPFETPPPRPPLRSASVKIGSFCRCIPYFYGFMPSRGAATFRPDSVTTTLSWYLNFMRRFKQSRSLRQYFSHASPPP